MATCFVEKRIEIIKVFEIEAKNCEEAKKLIDENEKNGNRVELKVKKTLLNVSGLYREREV